MFLWWPESSTSGDGYIVHRNLTEAGDYTIFDDDITYTYNTEAKNIYPAELLAIAGSEERKVYSPTPGSDGQTWTKGSNADLTISFKSDYNDDETYDRFTGIRVDGAEVEQTAANYEVRKGSAIITLKPAYLETLSVGKHTLTAVFDDGESAASFNVAEKKATPDDSGKKPENKSKPADTVVTCQMAGYPSSYAWNEAAKACQAGYLDNNGVFHPANGSRRAVIPGTGDKGLFGNLAVLVFSTLAAILSAYALKNH